MIEILEIKLAQCVNDDNEKVITLNKLTEALFHISSEKALEYGEQALELATKIDNKKEKVNALNNIGILNRKLNHYDIAFKFHQHALQISEEIGEKASISGSYNNIGAVYYMLCNFDKALEYYLKSLKIKTEIENKSGIAGSYNNIGAVYYMMKNFDMALEYYLKSSKISEEIEDNYGIASALNNMGIIYKIQSNYDKALECNLKALKIRTENGNNDGIAGSNNNIGNIYFALGNFNMALEYFLKSLKISEELKDKWGSASTLNNIGNLYVRLSHYENAYSYLEQGLQQASEISAKDLIEESYKGLSDLYIAKDDYKKALAYFKLYSEIKDSIYTEENRKQIAELQTKFEAEKKEKEAEIFRLKNVELVDAYQKIKDQREHLRLITKILRHDLKNNLTVILSAIKLFFRNEDKTFLEEVVKKVKKSNDLIDKMRELEILIHSNQNLKPFSIRTVFDEILKNYANKEIILFCLSVSILADDTIYSVFDNIIDNAFIHGKTDKVEISMKEEKDNLIINIADFGKGIPDSIKEQIFDESFKYGETGNTGLGLFIVKKAVNSFGGKVYVIDNKPQGSIFVLKFKTCNIEDK